MSKMKLALIPSIFLVFSGCAVSTYYLQDGAKTYPPTDPNNVKVYAAGSLRQKYDVIGSIAVDGVGGADDALKLLREKAADLGANAILDTRLVKMVSYTSRTGLSGVAVRTY